MELYRVASPDDALYAPSMEIYHTSFPLHEQREATSQATILSHPDYHFLAAVDAGAPAGILLTWDTPCFRYVEHFAISPALRGQSCGSRILKRWIESEPTPVILEIDPLTTEIAMRRKGFYERLGFVCNPYPHVHPPYRAENAGHDLLVLSCPEALPQETYDAFAQYLRGVVMA